MRARILFAGLLVAAACSDRPADSADPSDAAAAPDLALSRTSDRTPVASDLEANLPASAEPLQPTPRREDVLARVHEPIGAAPDGDRQALAEPAMPAEASHVHPRASGADEAVSSPTAAAEPAPGGGKPDTGVTEGLGEAPDRGWGDIGIIDDPNPLPGLPGRGGAVIIDDANPLPGLPGRGGAVIIRGGAGGIDDDCAIHRPGGIAGGGTGVTARPGGALVNDRDPRRGAAINERAPRTRSGGSLPRGAGFPRGGIR